MDKTFKIYENMDKLDVLALINAAGTVPCEWPKGKKFKVMSGGNEIAVTTYFSKANEKTKNIGIIRDAAAELSDMMSREEVVAEMNAKDPNHRTDAVNFATPKFRQNSPLLNDDQIEQRNRFIACIAALINDQQTMEAVVSNAVKKKNGTLYKGRVQKIALSGMCDYWDKVYAIVARNKTDTTISITFEDFTSKPGDLNEWNNDFISVYHEGLPVSKALESILG